MNFKQKLFLTTALLLTTVVGNGQVRQNTANDKQSNKTEQTVSKETLPDSLTIFDGLIYSNVHIYNAHYSINKPLPFIYEDVSSNITRVGQSENGMYNEVDISWSENLKEGEKVILFEHLFIPPASKENIIDISNQEDNNYGTIRYANNRIYFLMGNNEDNLLKLLTKTDIKEIHFVDNTVTYGEVYGTKIRLNFNNNTASEVIFDDNIHQYIEAENPHTRPITKREIDAYKSALDVGKIQSKELDNKTGQTINQSVVAGAPEELSKIIPGDKNTGFPQIVDVDISKELGLESGRRFARYFNNSDKPGEFLTKFGPFYPSDDINDPDYVEKLNNAAKESYKKVSQFLKANKTVLDNAFSQQGISEIDYKRNQVTFSFDDGNNFTINVKNKTVVPSVFNDMRAGFIAIEGDIPLKITASAPQPFQDMLSNAEATLAIGAKTGNTYVTKPSQFNP